MIFTKDPRLTAARVGPERLTFDELNLNGSVAPMPVPYREFTFANMSVMQPVGLFGDNRHSGFVRGTVSGNQVAYFGSNGAIDIINSTGTYTFKGVWMTAGADSSLTVNVFGLHNNAVLYSQTVVINDRTPLHFTPNWAGVDRILFQTGAETHDPKSPSSGPFVVLDNLVVSAINTSAAAPGAHAFAEVSGSAFGHDQIPDTADWLSPHWVHDLSQLA